MASSETPPLAPASNDSASFFQPNEIRSATDADFEYFVQLADDRGDSWIKKLDKNGLIIWQKESGVSSIKMARVIGEFPEVSAGTVFDTLLDGKYRRIWDENMIADFEYCRLDDYNDVGYYSMRCPIPLKNRDFVNQRSWRVYGDHQFVMFNHSVNIKALPLDKRFIRGISYITGFLIRSSGTGCTCTYVTQTDPKGKIPSWLINLTINTIAPSIFKKLYMACLKYEDWKSANSPGLKPWRHPEQHQLQVIGPAHLLSMNGEESQKERESPDGEAGQEDDELPEDEDMMKEIVDNIAKKLDAETSSATTSNGKSNGDADS